MTESSTSKTGWRTLVLNNVKWACETMRCRRQHQSGKQMTPSKQSTIAWARFKLTTRSGPSTVQTKRRWRLSSSPGKHQRRSNSMFTEIDNSPDIDEREIGLHIILPELSDVDHSPPTQSRMRQRSLRF